MAEAEAEKDLGARVLCSCDVAKLGEMGTDWREVR